MDRVQQLPNWASLEVFLTIFKAANSYCWSDLREAMDLLVTENRLRVLHYMVRFNRTLAQFPSVEEFYRLPDNEAKNKILRRVHEQWAIMHVTKLHEAYIQAIMAEI